MQNINWKLPLIIVGSVFAVIIMCIFGVQSSQNKAIGLEEAIYTADSDIKVQEMARVSKVYNLADWLSNMIYTSQKPSQALQRA